MKQYRRREFLRFGAALPLALHSLNARAASTPGVKAPPKRVIFICNSLGFYEPNFFPTKRGGLDQFQVSQRDGSEGENDGLSKPLSPGDGDQQP